MSEFKEDVVYLKQIERACDNVIKFSQNKTWQQIANNDRDCYAITKGIELIWDNTNKLSEQFKNENPDIPWQDIKGMRNKMVQDCDNINFKVVMDTIRNDLPALKEKIGRIIKQKDKKYHLNNRQKRRGRRL